jgi:hypothetical protein
MADADNRVALWDRIFGNDEPPEEEKERLAAEKADEESYRNLQRRISERTGKPEFTGVSEQGMPVGLIEAAPAKAATAGKGFIRKLLDLGIPEAKVSAAAEDIRLGGHTVFTDTAGKPVLTVGEHSPAGRALADYGKQQAAAREAAAGGFDYSGTAEQAAEAAPRVPKPPKISGEAKAFYDETGVDPTRRSALDTLAEMRKKGIIRNGK